MNQALVGVETISKQGRVATECGHVSHPRFTGFRRAMERDDAGDPTPDGSDHTSDNEHSENGFLHIWIVMALDRGSHLFLWMTIR